jgi:hypothetical protein
MRTHPITRRRFIEALGMAGAAAVLGATPEALPPLRASLRAQLQGCGRVCDMEGHRVSIEALGDWVYALRRHREASAPQHRITTVDILSAPDMASQLARSIHAFYQRRFGVVALEKTGVALVNEELPYTIFDMPDAGCNVAVFSAPIAPRQLWFLDWADLAAGIDPARIEAEHPTNHFVLENVGGFIA